MSYSPAWEAIRFNAPSWHPDAESDMLPAPLGKPLVG